MAKKLTIEDFNNRIDLLLEQMPEAILDVMERSILVAKKDVNKRIVDTGKSATGAPLKEYTPAYLQFKKDVGRYRGFVDLQLGNYSINKRIEAVRARQKLKVKKMRLAGKKSKRKFASKAELKEIKAKRRARANPQGGQLWADIQLTTKEARGTEYVVAVAPLHEINKKKAEKLSEKRGDFLALSEQEQDKLVNISFANDFEKYVQKIFNK